MGPPKLTFRIERHGGTVCGSSRAEMQYWVVDVDAATAMLEKSGRRQLRSMQPRLDVTPLAETVAELIVNGERHDWLKWHSPERVRVLVGKILPERSAVKQTLAGRRRRFWAALYEKVESMGWHGDGYIFEKDAVCEVEAEGRAKE